MDTKRESEAARLKVPKTPADTGSSGAGSGVTAGPSPWLNYHHLLYFWTVGRLGSVTAASDELRLAQPTISAQLRSLEDSLGEQLFLREGRRLQMTEVGRLVFEYADEIFGLGKELREVLRRREGGRPARLVVGVSDAMPKMIVSRIVAPAVHLKPPPRLVCREGRLDRLLADLSTHDIDVVLADAPLTSATRVRAYNHLL